MTLGCGIDHVQLSDTKWSVSAGLTKHKKHLQQHWKKAEAAAKKATDSFVFYIVKMLLTYNGKNSPIL